jgi:uncharacterized protein (DUF1330 family)
VSVEDPDLYREYTDQVRPYLGRAGGRFIVRGGQSENREGDGRPRNVVVEFESYAAARAAYEATEYQNLVKLRQRATEADFVIVEGL